MWYCDVSIVSYGEGRYRLNIKLSQRPVVEASLSRWTLEDFLAGRIMLKLFSGQLEMVELMDGVEVNKDIWHRSKIDKSQQQLLKTLSIS